MTVHDSGTPDVNEITACILAPVSSVEKTGLSKLVDHAFPEWRQSDYPNRAANSPFLRIDQRQQIGSIIAFIIATAFVIASAVTTLAAKMGGQRRWIGGHIGGVVKCAIRVRSY